MRTHCTNPILLALLLLTLGLLGLRWAARAKGKPNYGSCLVTLDAGQTALQHYLHETGKLPHSMAALTQIGLHPEYAARLECAPVATFGITTNSPPATVLMRCRISTVEGRRHVLSLAGDILLVDEGDAALGTEYASGKNVMPTSR